MIEGGIAQAQTVPIASLIELLAKARLLHLAFLTSKTEKLLIATYLSNSKVQISA